jgi:hypothetical protein
MIPPSGGGEITGWRRRAAEALLEFFRTSPRASGPTT